jgi:cob(I)alamin adenosyltransferase
MTKFYTQTGDDGYTGLIGKGRIRKYDRRIEAIGALDEANAAIGLARSIALLSQTSSILITVQKDLYHMMAEIAAQPENVLQFRNITSERVIWLENIIEEINNQTVVSNEFIIPGDSKGGAAIDLARTIIRRAERHVAYLLHQKKIENRELLRYINRLSSLCFVLELLEIHASGCTHPTIAKE